MKKLELLSLFPALLLLVGHISGQRPLEVSLNTLQTATGTSSVGAHLHYTLPEEEGLSNPLHDFQNGLLTYAPDFSFQGGTADAFSALSFKAQGFLMFFQTDTIDGIIEPSSQKYFHVLPFSVGFETSNAFQTVNGLAEVGYSTQYHRPKVKIPKLFKYSQIGVFLQGGYKMHGPGDAIPAPMKGGNADKSAESPENAILRAKGQLKVNTNRIRIFKNLPNGFALSGISTGWYDFLNKEVYYRIEGNLRVFLTDQHSLDFKYEKGSGAPNFNQGNQFGVGLTVGF